LKEKQQTSGVIALFHASLFDFLAADRHHQRQRRQDCVRTLATMAFVLASVTDQGNMSVSVIFSPTAR